MRKLRTVVEEELVKARILQAIKEYPHLQRMWEQGVIWLLSRAPERGKPIPGTDRYAYWLPSWAPGGLPSISITYRITENEVIIEKSRIDKPRASKKRS